MQAELGISPVAWWNDDLAELSDNVSLDECLRQARAAGYRGVETGRRFPMDPAVLGPVLDAHDLRICGGWFSGRILDRDISAEKDRIAEQIALFKAMDAPCLVYGETTGSIQGDRTAPLSTKIRLDDSQIAVYGRAMTAFAEWCADQGMRLSFHHHVGTAIETEDELDRLMNHSGEALALLFDAGHLYVAGGDPLRVIDRHHTRINHVHVKDVRAQVMRALDRDTKSFLDAVLKGIFTVPGDGSLDFAAIAQRLASYGYAGWFVVEAEQDPVAHPPLEMAVQGHRELVRVLRLAGYELAAAP